MVKRSIATLLNTTVAPFRRPLPKGLIKVNTDNTNCKKSRHHIQNEVIMMDSSSDSHIISTENGSSRMMHHNRNSTRHGNNNSDSVTGIGRDSDGKSRVIVIETAKE